MSKANRERGFYLRETMRRLEIQPWKPGGGKKAI